MLTLLVACCLAVVGGSFRRHVPRSVAKRLVERGAVEAVVRFKLNDEVSESVAAVFARPTFPPSSRHDARHRAHGLHLWWEFDTEDGASALAAIDAMEGNLSLAVHLETAEFGLRKAKTYVMNDEFYEDSQERNLDAVNIPASWSEFGGGSSNVTVQVVDNGVALEHPDLLGSGWLNPGEVCGNGLDDDGNGYVDDCYGYNHVDSHSDVQNNGDSHGTHCAGLIAASSDNEIGIAGVAGGKGGDPGVRLMTSVVFGADGVSGGAAQALVYGADEGARVSSNSWTYTEAGAFEQVVIAAIDYAVAQGVVVVFAAGNDDSGADFYPGFYDAALTVGAVARSGDRASFSNYGSHVDIAAPGINVLSTNGTSDYALMSGTSMAAPLVSGTVALAFSQQPNAKVSDVIDCVLSTARNISALNVEKPLSLMLDAHATIACVSGLKQQANASLDCESILLSGASLRTELMGSYSRAREHGTCEGRPYYVKGAAVLYFDADVDGESFWFVGSGCNAQKDMLLYTRDHASVGEIEEPWFEFDLEAKEWREAAINLTCGDTQTSSNSSKKTSKKKKKLVFMIIYIIFGAALSIVGLCVCFSCAKRQHRDVEEGLAEKIPEEAEMKEAPHELTEAASSREVSLVMTRKHPTLLPDNEPRTPRYQTPRRLEPCPAVKEEPPPTYSRSKKPPAGRRRPVKEQDEPLPAAAPPDLAAQRRGDNPPPEDTTSRRGRDEQEERGRLLAAADLAERHRRAVFGSNSPSPTRQDEQEEEEERGLVAPPDDPPRRRGGGEEEQGHGIIAPPDESPRRRGGEARRRPPPPPSEGPPAPPSQERPRYYKHGQKGRRRKGMPPLGVQEEPTSDDHPRSAEKVAAPLKKKKGGKERPASTPAAFFSEEASAATAKHAVDYDDDECAMPYERGGGASRRRREIDVDDYPAPRASSRKQREEPDGGAAYERGGSRHRRLDGHPASSRRPDETELTNDDAMMMASYAKGHRRRRDTTTRQPAARRPPEQRRRGGSEDGTVDAEEEEMMSHLGVEDDRRGGPTSSPTYMRGGSEREAFDIADYPSGQREDRHHHDVAKSLIEKDLELSQPKHWDLFD